MPMSNEYADNEYAILPTKYLDLLAAYSDEEIGRIAKAIMIFRHTGQETAFDGPEKYIMPSIYADQRRAIEKYTAKRESAKSAAESRWKKRDASECESMRTDADASDAMRTMPYKNKEKEKNNSPSESIPPIPPKRGRKKTTQELPDPDFEAFWALYPKKKSKGDAKKAWAQIKPSGELVSAIMAKLKLLTASHEWTKENGEYVPYPASWLRAEGWEDEVKDAPRKDSFPTPAKPGEAPRVPSRAKQNAEWMQNALAEMDAEEEGKQDERV